MLLALGVRRIAGREAGLIAGALAGDQLRLRHVEPRRADGGVDGRVHGGRVVLLRPRADAAARGAALAAACALLAYFTKAAAIFFVAALGVEAVLILIRPTAADNPASRRAAMATLAGLTVCGLIALAVFVVPNWTDYRFYNWQMSVTRKPSYDLQSLLNRVTWFPIVHDIFTRMWFTVVVGVLGLFAALARWRAVPPAERLLALWIGLGALELLLHDVGNERRFVFFIPALVALDRDRARERSPPGAGGARGHAAHAPRSSPCRSSSTASTWSSAH